MRVVTWNVWGRFGVWQQREPAILQTLTSVRPDLLALQETWNTSEVTQAEVLSTALGLHATYAASRMPVDSDPDVELGLAVLSRWPLLRAQHCRLPSRDAPETIALLVEIDHPAGRLHLATTCLDWEQDHGSPRLAQAHALGTLLNDPGLDGPLPVLLAGDLNAPPDDAEIHALTSTMTDCWTTRRHDDPGHTYSSSNPHTKRDDWHVDSRIDYVLARAGKTTQPLDVLHAALVGMDASDGKPVPSDHYAVVVDLHP